MRSPFQDKRVQDNKEQIQMQFIGTHELIALDRLVVPAYQRGIKRATQRRIDEDGWNEIMAPALDVAPNGDGTYNIIDGHNRWAAAKRHGLNAYYCRILHLTEQQQAQAFIQLNRYRVRIATIEEHKGACLGQVRIALEIQKELDNANLSFGRSSRWDVVSGVKTIYDVYNAGEATGVGGAKHLGRVLRLLYAGWTNNEKAFDRGPLGGLSKLLLSSTAYEDDLIIEMLRRVTVEHDIYRTAYAYSGGKNSTGAKYVAKAMQSEYNKRRSSKAVHDEIV